MLAKLYPQWNDLEQDVYRDLLEGDIPKEEALIAECQNGHFCVGCFVVEKIRNKGKKMVREQDRLRQIILNRKCERDYEITGHGQDWMTEEEPPYVFIMVDRIEDGGPLACPSCGRQTKTAIGEWRQCTRCRELSVNEMGVAIHVPVENIEDAPSPELAKQMILRSDSPKEILDAVCQVWSMIVGAFRDSVRPKVWQSALEHIDEEVERSAKDSLANLQRVVGDAAREVFWDESSLSARIGVEALTALLSKDFSSWTPDELNSLFVRLSGYNQVPRSVWEITRLFQDESLCMQSVLIKGDYAYDSGHYGSAIKAYTLAEDALSRRQQLQLGICYRRQGNLDKAVELLDSWIMAARDDPDMSLDGLTHLYDAFYEMAGVSVEQEDWRGAELLFWNSCRNALRGIYNGDPSWAYRQLAVCSQEAGHSLARWRLREGCLDRTVLDGSWSSLHTLLELAKDPESNWEQAIDHLCQVWRGYGYADGLQDLLLGNNDRLNETLRKKETAEAEKQTLEKIMIEKELENLMLRGQLARVLSGAKPYADKLLSDYPGMPSFAATLIGSSEFMHKEQFKGMAPHVMMSGYALGIEYLLREGLLHLIYQFALSARSGDRFVCAGCKPEVYLGIRNGLPPHHPGKATIGDACRLLDEPRSEGMMKFLQSGMPSHLLAWLANKAHRELKPFSDFRNMTAHAKDQLRQSHVEHFRQLVLESSLLKNLTELCQACKNSS